MSHNANVNHRKSTMVTHWHNDLQAAAASSKNKVLSQIEKFSWTFTQYKA